MTHFFIVKNGYKLGLRPHPEGYCFVYESDDDKLLIPLELRDLIALRSSVNDAISELQNDLEEEPFNPSW